MVFVRAVGQLRPVRGLAESSLERELDELWGLGRVAVGPALDVAVRSAVELGVERDRSLAVLNVGEVVEVAIDVRGIAHVECAGRCARGGSGGVGVGGSSHRFDCIKREPGDRVKPPLREERVVGSDVRFYLGRVEDRRDPTRGVSRRKSELVSRVAWVVAYAAERSVVGRNEGSGTSDNRPPIVGSDPVRLGLFLAETLGQSSPRDMIGSTLQVCKISLLYARSCEEIFGQLIAHLSLLEQLIDIVVAGGSESRGHDARRKYARELKWARARGIPCRIDCELYMRQH